VERRERLERAALNKSSGAYGIPQSLPASKMASAGGDWKTNPATQIKWGLSYIASRYGNPLNAYSKWLARSPHWYAKGTGGAAPGLAWVGEKGPELVNFKGGEDVLSTRSRWQFAKANGIKLPGYASGTILNAADRVHRDRQRVEDAKDDLARAKRRHKGVAAAEKRLEAAEKELKAAEISLRNAQRSAKTSIANTIATGLLKTLSTGTVVGHRLGDQVAGDEAAERRLHRTAANMQKKGGSWRSSPGKRASSPEADRCSQPVRRPTRPGPSRTSCPSAERRRRASVTSSRRAGPSRRRPATSCRCRSR
jgi:hypothetical protein